MNTNSLANEKSPYLLQHAHNPVDWLPWGEEAFTRALTEDKPIFLSIGYSTCHWCHVMERESFENDDVAAVLNRYFVPIKVDREERPDVDRIYMTFVQATTGGGGWPMSVWLTPELKPFFAGTYFPPDSRWGRPGFRSLLEQLAAAWRTDRASIVKSGDEMLGQIRDAVAGTMPGRADSAIAESCFYGFRRSYDKRLGGFGGAPKFPRPSVLNFLLRYAVFSDNDEARDMALHTLREMARGGMYDQLGGGFHRYSVDARWFVPHFEKMLYDQAQLAVSYIEAWQMTGDDSFADVARGTLEYVLRDMTHPEGGFFSAEDADSVIDPAHPHEKGEGAFYIWSREELDQRLESPAADWFSYRYGVEPYGNVAEDPHSEFTGRNILYQRFDSEEVARHFGVTVNDVRSAITEAGKLLFAERDKRVRPHLDDKILTAWNGLMISAFAKAGAALQEPRYLDAARRAADFVLNSLYRNGLLLRRWREGDAAIEGFLDDYAFFAQGLLDLYQATLEIRYADVARELTLRMRELFEDSTEGGFYSTTERDPSLVLRMKEDYDGAEPSGNSIAALNLLRLARMTGEESLERSGSRALDAFSSRMSAGATGFPQLIVALLYAATPPRQIVYAGSGTEIAPLRRVADRRFLPFHDVLASHHGTLNPELNNFSSVDTPAVFVCENFTCQLPVRTADDLERLLQS
ncbi:MAG TPA: thioredoxin domain-containing protein [Bryobacteraceae bacterium]|nr:thioredoxin domain-containing protein [Bryobacteraceae bacterium]